MFNAEMIEEVKKRLINTYNPNEIYIFGSYAWGSPDEDSDLDLVVVVEKLEKDRYKSMADGHMALATLRLSKDILLFTQEEFDERANDITTLCYKVKHDGKLLYARA